MAKFLSMLHIYRVLDLRYQSRVSQLAVILSDIGGAWRHDTNRDKLAQWYWNAAFGEF